MHAPRSHHVLAGCLVEDGVEAVLPLLVLPHVLQGEHVRHDQRVFGPPGSLELQHGTRSSKDAYLALHVLHHVMVLLPLDVLVLHNRQPSGMLGVLKIEPYFLYYLQYLLIYTAECQDQ